MQVACFSCLRFSAPFARCGYLRFYISGRPLLCSPREWKRRNGHGSTSDPPGAAWFAGGRGEEKKNTVFGRNVCVSVGSGQGYWLYGCRSVFFWSAQKGLEEEGGGGGRGGKAAAAPAPPLPGNGAPSPACGSAVVPATGEPLPAFAPFFCLVWPPVFDTRHVQGGGASSRSYVCIKKEDPALDEHIFLLLLSGCSGCEDVGPSIRPAASSLPTGRTLLHLCALFAGIFARLFGSSERLFF